MKKYDLLWTGIWMLAISIAIATMIILSHCNIPIIESDPFIFP